MSWTINLRVSLKKSYVVLHRKGIIIMSWTMNLRVSLKKSYVAIHRKGIYHVMDDESKSFLKEKLCSFT